MSSFQRVRRLLKISFSKAAGSPDAEAYCFCTLRWADD